MSAIEQLLSISSPSLISGPTADGVPLLEKRGRLGAELRELLVLRNGFYAYESALHVFPSGVAAGVMDLATWNGPDTWRSEYGDLADDCLFFAQDAFGLPFCIHDDRVCSFAETGEIEVVAESLEDWAGRILVDSALLLGYPIAHEWQRANGPLAPGKRLAPAVPFMLGGEYDVEGLHDIDQADLMRFRGMIAVQIRDLPDGAEVRLEIAR